MAATSLLRNSTEELYQQQEFVDSSPQVLPLCIVGLWTAFWFCGERDPSNALGKMLVLGVDKLITPKCDLFLGCPRAASQEECF